MDMEKLLEDFKFHVESMDDSAVRKSIAKSIRDSANCFDDLQATQMSATN